MNPTDARLAAPSDADIELDGFLEAFEAAAARDGAADPAAFLPPAGHPKYAAVLRELLRVDLEFAWDRGEERRVEAYRGRFPALFADPEGLRAVAWEEFRLRQAAGEAPTPAEYRRRFGIELFGPAGNIGFPDTTGLADPDDDFSADLVEDGSAAEMPTPGDTIRGFEVLAELGRGAFGRVFLAREAGLAGRLVALKVSSRLPGESQTLARLQHTNIVPVYSVHRNGPFHLICMPYLGATTLADLLDVFRGPAGLPASGKGLVSTLADRAYRTTGERATSHPEGTPESTVHGMPQGSGFSRVNLERLEHLSYAETVLWIGAQLADGLAHAHERGVLHRDLKPANVLLADDGRPMLLDFNLAADAAGGETPAGGTLRYMPPEALEALEAGLGHADARADVYGLGLLLYELLTGTFPFPDPAPGVGGPAVLAKLRADRLAPLLPASSLSRDVSPATASILATCLDPDPARRYPSAAALRDDLQRQLDSRPLRFAPEPSARERLAKWARRHPRLASFTTAAVTAAAVLLLVVGAFVVRQRHLDRLEAANYRNTLRVERDAVGAMVHGPDTPLGLCVQAERRAAAVLEPYAALTDPAWANGPLLRRLPDEEQVEARRDVSFVLGDYADALAGRAGREADPGRKAGLLDAALHANEQAACVDDPALTPRLRRQRMAFLYGAGRTEEAARIEAALASADTGDDESRVKDAVRSGRHAQVIELLEPLTRGGSPSSVVWSRLGYARLRRGEFAAAVRCFDRAEVLAPRESAVWFYRGLALLEVGHHTEAAADFSRFLDRHPDDPESLLNRALARIELKDHVGAVADLDRLEQLGAPFTRLYFVREHARRLARDAAGAEQDFRTGLAREPADPLSWVARGRARLRLTPPDVAGALADFEKAVALDPRLTAGWDSIAETLSERLGRPDDAVKALGKVLELQPGHIAARAGRAVLHARAGRRDLARKDAEACHESDAGALVLYQIGCVYLLSADGPADRARGLELLRACLRKDTAWAKSMPDDPDLKSVRGSDEFRELVAAANALAR